MKKNLIKHSTKTHRKLTLHQEAIRCLSDLNMRAVNGGLQTGHETCDSGMCESWDTKC